MNKVFFYDGDCAFCIRMIRSFKRVNQNPEIQFLPYQMISESDRLLIHSELTDSKVKAEVQFVQDGNRYPGFFAVRKIFPNFKYYKYFTPLLYFPLVPFIGMWVMFLMKKGRRFF
jgi:predicted DCC family thiol-disulfide oxidoreductase YuxK